MPSRNLERGSSALFSWRRRRKKCQQQVIRDADNLMPLFRDRAYAEAVARSQHADEAGGDPSHFRTNRHGTQSRTIWSEDPRLAGSDLAFVGGEGCQDFGLLTLRDLDEIQGSSELRCDLIEFFGGDF